MGNGIGRFLAVILIGAGVAWWLRTDLGVMKLPIASAGQESIGRTVLNPLKVIKKGEAPEDTTVQARRKLHLLRDDIVRLSKTVANPRNADPAIHSFTTQHLKYLSNQNNKLSSYESKLASCATTQKGFSTDLTNTSCLQYSKQIIASLPQFERAIEQSHANYKESVRKASKLMTRTSKRNRSNSNGTDGTVVPLTGYRHWR